MKYIWVLVLCTGCCGLNEAYVKQDRANYETLAPVVRKYLNETDILDDETEADVEDRLQAWDLWTSMGVRTFE